MPGSEFNDPLAIFHVLARAGVPFVIIGGHAVTFWRQRLGGSLALQEPD